MSSTNLGTMFAPLILCPRKLSPESIQSNHQLLTKAVSAMIDNEANLFKLPARLRTDIEMCLKNREQRNARSPIKALPPSVTHDGKVHSPVVNTVYSFVGKINMDEEDTPNLAFF